MLKQALKLANSRSAIASQTNSKIGVSLRFISSSQRNSIFKAIQLHQLQQQRGFADKPAGDYKSPQEKEAEQFKAYMEQEEIKRKGTKFGKYLQYSVLGLIGVFSLLAIFQPWHSYSDDTAKSLRKGLWAESDKENDYMKALQNYQEALKQCKEEGMNQLDPRYTGIVLKIGEMYEKLQMYDEQKKTYTGLSKYLFGRLVNDQVPDEWKDSVLQRDLIVMNRIITLTLEKGSAESKSNSNIDRLMKELIDRIRFAEGRVKKEWPMLADVHGSDEKELDITEVIALKTRAQKKKFVEENLPKETVKFIESWTTSWPVFTPELISSRDLYATLAMFLNKNELAVNILESNILWMKLSGCEPIFIGTAISNLASAYYLNMEKHEIISTQINFRIKHLLEKSFKKEQFRQEEVVKWRRILEVENNIIESSSKQSEKVYKSLIDLLGDVKKIDPKDEISISCIGMSNFGLGVVYLHRGDYEQSSIYLNNAKKIGSEFGLPQLVEKSTYEIEKLRIQKLKLSSSFDEKTSKKISL
ncbi:hypothetical protein B5S28_g3440 [[Candida] boidinii]|nr:hypothetical protein B5S28_g3440 [[Candida] boidinii]